MCRKLFGLKGSVANKGKRFRSYQMPKEKKKKKSDKCALFMEDH